MKRKTISIRRIDYTKCFDWGKRRRDKDLDDYNKAKDKLTRAKARYLSSEKNLSSIIDGKISTIEFNIFIKRSR